MKKPTIYPDRSQELLALFEQAGNNKKVMCVPIDYAKKDHHAVVIPKASSLQITLT